jgi:hypothetical protein
VHQQFWLDVDLFATMLSTRRQVAACLCLQEERILGGLTGSATSVAINHTTELLASAR